MSSNIPDIQGSLEDTSKVISELDRLDTNWRDMFIHSALEPESKLTGFFLEQLNLHVVINSVSIYLLVMLLIIFVSKFIFSPDTQISSLNKYYLGRLFNKFFISYLKIWQTSGNI